MKKRPLVSIAISFLGTGIIVTGVWSYFVIHHNLLSAFHVISGLFFTIFLVFHLLNNWRPLTGYFTQKNSRRELLVALALNLALAAAVFFHLPPVGTIIDWGKNLRQQSASVQNISYTITTRGELAGKPILIDLVAGPAYQITTTLPNGRVIRSTPQVAIWVENQQGEFLETLYVSYKSAKGQYQGPDPQQERRRPEALPVWSFAQNRRAPDQLYMPSRANPLPDAYTHATMASSFAVQSTAPVVSYLIKIEVNNSFDFNEFYHPKRFPHDPVYSQSPNGQPSVIYGAQLPARPGLVLAKLIGHGHPSGATGTIYPDLTELTTAQEILKGIVINYQ